MRRAALCALLLAAAAPRCAAQPLRVVAPGTHCSNRESPTADSHGGCGPGSTIGAEIVGVANFTTLSDDDIAVIRRALSDYKVIWFRGAAHLFTPDSQLDFALRFGPVRPEVSTVPRYVERGVHQSKHSVRNDKTGAGGRTGTDDTASINTMVEANKPGMKVWEGKEMPGRVARLVREPGDPFAFGEGYHADVTFFESPPVFTFLVGRELPGGEDDTFFLDAARAYETLPGDLREAVTGMNAVHNDSAGMANVHPVVRTHPENGKQVLYVNSHFTRKLVGYGDDEGKELLDRLFDHIESMPIYKFKWAHDVDTFGTTHPDSMHAVMWDNRQLQHTATTFWARNRRYNVHRRELHRVTISSDQRPYYRPRGNMPFRVETGACPDGL